MKSCHLVFKFHLLSVLLNVPVTIHLTFKSDNFIRVLTTHREYAFKRESPLRAVLSEAKMLRLQSILLELNWDKGSVIQKNQFHYFFLMLQESSSIQENNRIESFVMVIGILSSSPHYRISLKMQLNMQHSSLIKT